MSGCREYRSSGVAAPPINLQHIPMTATWQWYGHPKISCLLIWNQKSTEQIALIIALTITRALSVSFWPLKVINTKNMANILTRLEWAARFGRQLFAAIGQSRIRCLPNLCYRPMFSWLHHAPKSVLSHCETD
jgi:hypothetical protein